MSLQDAQMLNVELTHALKSCRELVAQVKMASAEKERIAIARIEQLKRRLEYKDQIVYENEERLRQMIFEMGRDIEKLRAQLSKGFYPSVATDTAVDEFADMPALEMVPPAYDGGCGKPCSSSVVCAMIGCESCGKLYLK